MTGADDDRTPSSDGAALIVMAGLPGSGKSTVAGRVAWVERCVLLSVDPIELSLWRSGIDRDQPTGLAAYVVAEEVARQQLAVGRRVIVDAVNDVVPAREQWRALARDVGCPLVLVEVVCGDEAEHRRRLEGRVRDLEGFPEPTWASVVARRAGFDDWRDDRLRVDTVRPLDEVVGLVRDHLRAAVPVHPGD